MGMQSNTPHRILVHGRSLQCQHSVCRSLGHSHTELTSWNANQGRAALCLDGIAHGVRGGSRPLRSCCRPPGDDASPKARGKARAFDSKAACDEVISADNRLRAEAKLPPLSASTKLQAAAEKHAKDMASMEKMTHKGSDGSSSIQRIVAKGYKYRRAGENVAAGYFTVDALMKGWMDSPPHKRNILGSYSQIGVASRHRRKWQARIGASRSDFPREGNPRTFAVSSRMFEYRDPAWCLRSTRTCAILHRRFERPMRGYRWKAIASLLVVLGASVGCQGVGRTRTVVSPEPTLSARRRERYNRHGRKSRHADQDDHRRRSSSPVLQASRLLGDFRRQQSRESSRSHLCRRSGRNLRRVQADHRRSPARAGVIDENALLNEFHNWKCVTDADRQSYRHASGITFNELNDLPSSDSRNAPPPVETCDTRSANPNFSTASADSPPPTAVTAVESASGLRDCLCSRGE